jgi:anti-anti-sigma factor
MPAGLHRSALAPGVLEVRVDDSIPGLGQVTLTGELDLCGAAATVAAVRQALPGSAIVILNLRGLAFCDTAGVHAVLEANSLAEAAGARMVVLPAIRSVHRVFALTGADRMLQAFGSLPGE